jgi:hypothetical protein
MRASIRPIAQCNLLSFTLDFAASVSIDFAVSVSIAIVRRPTAANLIFQGIDD